VLSPCLSSALNPVFPICQHEKQQNAIRPAIKRENSGAGETGRQAGEWQRRARREQIVPMSKMDTTPVAGLPALPTVRLSPKLRKALHLLVYKGMSVNDAAEAAGMLPNSLSRATHRPDIAAHLEGMKAQLTLDADSLKGQARSQAILVGIDLMHNAKSEPVRARMVEFFAGEPKQNGSQVNIQVNAGGGYEYAAPGVKVVELQPDRASPKAGQNPNKTDGAE